MKFIGTAGFLCKQIQELKQFPEVLYWIYPWLSFTIAFIFGQIFSMQKNISTQIDSRATLRPFSSQHLHVKFLLGFLLLTLELIIMIRSVAYKRRGLEKDQPHGMDSHKGSIHCTRIEDLSDKWLPRGYRREDAQSDVHFRKIAVANVLQKYGTRDRNQLKS